MTSAKGSLPTLLKLYQFGLTPHGVTLRKGIVIDNLFDTSVKQIMYHAKFGFFLFLK